MSNKLEKWAKQRYQGIRKQKRMYFEKKKDFIYIHDENKVEIEKYANNYDFEQAFSLGTNFFLFTDSIVSSKFFFKS